MNRPVRPFALSRPPRVLSVALGLSFILPASRCLAQSLHQGQSAGADLLETLTDYVTIYGRISPSQFFFAFLALVLIMALLNMWQTNRRLQILTHDLEMQSYQTKVNESERLLMEVGMKRARDAAEAANRSKSEFLANMSHEIRTPMNAILGFTELLLSQDPSPQEREYLKTIAASGRTLLKLINDILDLSKVEAGKLEFHLSPVDPRRIFSEVEAVFLPKIKEKGLQFRTDVAAEVPRALMLDEIRVRQVLFNLVGNALKFTAQGSVSVSVQWQAAPDTSSEGTLIFQVEDTGIGIPADQQTLIFEAFQQQLGQQPGKYEGTGLGLTITRKLLEHMKGKVSVTSEVGRGSCFQVTLEHVGTAFKAEEPDEKLFTFDERDIFTGQSILIVDHIASNRQLFREYLARTGITVIEAATAPEAMHMAGQHKPSIVITDVRLPRTTPLDFLAQLRRLPGLQNTPAIVVTAVALKEDIEKMLRQGFSGHLRKPVARDDFLLLLATILPVCFRDEDGAPRSPEPTDEHEQLLEETLASLPELLTTLSGDLMRQWTTCRQPIIFSEAEAFATALVHLGETHRFPMLITYGNEIKKGASNFDIEKLPLILDRFPSVVQDIQSLLTAPPQKGNHPAEEKKI